MSIRVADLPDLGAVTDAASIVGDHAGSGRFTATALRSYIAATFASTASLTAEAALRKAVKLSAMDGFGCIGDGTTDDTTALQAALNSLGSAGGVLHLPHGYSFRVGNLTIPVGVTLEGPYPSGIGAVGLATSSPPNYNNLSFLRTNAGTTVTLKGGASLCGLLMAPYAMTFQQATSAAFAGIAVTGGGDDMTVENCMILGYSTAFTATGCSRIRIRDCNVDCQNGFDIYNSMDVCHLDNVQCWPFATISLAGTDTLRRSGRAFAMTGGVDDSRLVSCFSYGYAVGFAIDSCGGVALIGCAADHTRAGFGTGFAITGASWLTTMSGCLASAQVNGFYFSSTTANTVHMMADCVAFGNTTSNVLIDTTAVSAVSIRGGSNTLAPSGIVISSATAPVDIDGVYFTDITTAAQIIYCAVATSNVRVGPLCNYGQLAAGSVISSANFSSKAVVAADPLSLPPNAHVFNVTGSTNFGSLLSGWAGRVVTLIFAGAPVVFSSNTGVVSAMRLQNNLSYLASAGATLTLMHSGSQWFEIGRSGGGHAEAPGTATNDSAASGYIGEIITATVAIGSAVSLTTSTAADVASISLTAGDWDVNGSVGFTIGAATAAVLQSWISTVSATPPTAPATGGYAILSGAVASGTLLPTGTTRLSLASTTTVYLGAFCTFATSTVAAYGFIRARRVR